VTEYATLSNVKLSIKDSGDNPLDGMIQEVNDMRLDFYLPVPLNEGCKVQVTLPEEYYVAEVERVMTHNVFGLYRNYTVEAGNLVINENSNAFEIDPCSDYVENDDVATIYMFSLTQPNYEAATKSATIQINTKDGQPVAWIDEGVTFTPSRGAIATVTDATSYVVQSPTKVLIQLKP
jgi:hypothetical protein